MTLRISIVIPTFNRPTLARRAVASALTACPPDGEVIVVDDRSDTAIDALQRFADDPRLRIMTNTGPKGAAGARNFGVAAATGDLILFLDDDDVLVADYPDRVINAAQISSASYGFSSSSVVSSTDVEGETTAATLPAQLRKGLIGANVRLDAIVRGFCFGFWVRRKVFFDIGQIDTDLVVDEDGDFHIRLYGEDHKGWFDEFPGCIVTKGYKIATGNAPQLTQSTDPTLEAECRARTFRKNQNYFAIRSPDRWFLIRRTLRFSARAGVETVPRDILRDLQPLTWRLKGWLFWRIKKLGRR